MAVFEYTRRYNTLLYRIASLLVGGITIAFGAAAFHKPVAGLFAALFGVATIALVNGIFRGYSSGMTINDTTVFWWSNFGNKRSKSVELNDIRTVEWVRYDDEWINLTLADGSSVRIDQRYFDNGAVVLSAFASHSDRIAILENGKMWNG